MDDDKISQHCWLLPLPHTPRHKGFGCILGTQQSIRLPHIAKVDLVYPKEKSNTTPNHDTGYKIRVAMHHATVQQSFTSVSPNSHPTIVMLQEEERFVGKHSAVPFRCPVSHSSPHWWRKHLCFYVKDKRSNRRLADIPPCCK
ncbi:hypothetical protein TNCV_1370791 [Trichonephila clavipes]|nr:hypothetical protein TNCV_1370791 [Trichonephila clavipes]